MLWNLHAALRLRWLTDTNLFVEQEKGNMLRKNTASIPPTLHHLNVLEVFGVIFRTNDAVIGLSSERPSQGGCVLLIINH